MDGTGARGDHMAIDPTVDQTIPVEMDGQMPSAEIRAQLRDAGEPVLLAFSRGKDSLATWLAMREDGIENIIPFHLYRIPELRFVDESIKIFEDYFQTRIYQYPHPALWRWLLSLVFQAPENIRTIESTGREIYTYEDLHVEIKYDFGVAEDAWIADGCRACDSPNRRSAFKQRGPWRPNVFKVSPIWDWRISHVRDIQARHHCPLAVDYEWFKRSFDGIDYRFTEPLSRHAPDDYQRLLDWFPLADLELFRARLTRG
jgi:hypothetical protein